MMAILTLLWCYVVTGPNEKKKNFLTHQVCETTKQPAIADEINEKFFVTEQLFQLSLLLLLIHS